MNTSLIYPALSLILLSAAIRAWSASARRRGLRAAALFLAGLLLASFGVDGALQLRQKLVTLPPAGAWGVVGMFACALGYVVLKEWRELGSPKATTESPSSTKSAEPSSGTSTALP